MGGIAVQVPMQCWFLSLLGRPWLLDLLHGPSETNPNLRPNDIADHVAYHEPDHIADDARDDEPGELPDRVLLHAELRHAKRLLLERSSWAAHGRRLQLVGAIAAHVPMRCWFLLPFGRPLLHDLLHGPSDRFPNHQPNNITDDVAYHGPDHAADDEAYDLPDRVLLHAELRHTARLLLEHSSWAAHGRQ